MASCICRSYQKTLKRKARLLVEAFRDPVLISGVDQNPKITPDWIRSAKARGERIAALTAYDYPTARLLDEAGVPFLLVGDSVGMVVLGYLDPTHVTLTGV